MIDLYLRAVTGQFEAALSMLRECIEKCPDDRWAEPIGKYPFWHVAYHALCFADCYLSRGNDAFVPRPDFHPAGMLELSEEYPSRLFTRDELLDYLAVSRAKLREMLAADTRESLEAPSGFPWLPLSRAELHIYNLRHVQHHTGQLGAFLRRAGVDTRWVKTGTPAPPPPTIAG